MELDSGIPLQPVAKVPIMITFDVVDKDGDHANDLKLEACIFKPSKCLMLYALGLLFTLTLHLG
jgi:hypothetical protein